MKNRYILLIEDNQDDIDLTLRAFKKHRLVNDINVIKDGAEAVEFIFCTGRYASRDIADVPAFILLDLNLPKVNGMEILKQIRDNPKTKCIPVIILTSSKHDQDVINGYSLGVNSYIRKPVDFNKFMEAISQIEAYWLILNEPPIIT